MKNNFATILFGVFILILFINLSSADFSDWFGKFTGRATQQDTNVSVALNGTRGVSVAVTNSTLSSVSPTENSNTVATFYVQVTDLDGVNDINDTAVNVSFTKSGEVSRFNSSCSLTSDISSTTANYTCTVNIWYYDSTGAWVVNACGKDLGNTTYACNSTQNFTYNQLQALTLSPSSLTWATLTPGTENQTSNNDPTLINNTGNFNFTNITIRGHNLHGEVASSVLINVANFSVGNNTGSSAECDLSPATYNATRLTNGTDLQLKHTILTRGNHSVNTNATGQEQLYYCLLTVPQVQTQTYSTTYTGGAWLIIGTTS